MFKQRLGRGATVTLTAALLLASLLLVGCGKIYRFEPSPRHVLPGGTTTLYWRASLSPTLSSEPKREDLPKLGRLPAAGSLKVRVNEKTTFYLHVAGNDPHAGIVDVLPECCAAEAGTLTCASGHVTQTLELSAKNWGAMKLDHVQATDKPIRVLHDCIDVTLAPGEKTDAFRGHTFAGHWQFQHDTALACESPEVQRMLLEVKAGALNEPEESR